jgi:16S rRNA (guanine1207-N2)-methyltransferase
MSHYFSKNTDTKSNEKTIAYTYRGFNLSFISDHGVFSKDHVDGATDLLLNHLNINNGASILDLGTGYGIIGISVTKAFQTNTQMIDINERALTLATRNAQLNNVDVKIIYSDGFEAVNESFDHIISNPPIRIGKQSLYQLFKTAKEHLNKNGALWLVMHKKHGALSAIEFLKNHYEVHVVKKQKGFHVLQCINSLTN